jgi:hypothetical protein
MKETLERARLPQERIAQCAQQAGAVYGFHLRSCAIALVTRRCA